MEARVKALPNVLIPSKDDDDFDIVVPALQRDYRWECQNINEMFDDLATHFNNFSSLKPVEEDYFFGSVVYVKNEDEKRFDLIDGQQRLTTFSLVLRKTFDLLNSELENDTVDEDEDTSTIQEINSRIQEMLFDKNGECRIKFESDRHQKQYILESILSLERDDKKLKELKSETNEHTINYINRYNNISKKLDELFLGKGIHKITTFYAQITEHVQFVRIISKDENTVYQLFETLNARGENLSQTELLKNYLLSLIKGDSERFESLWQEISTNINSIQNSSKKAIYSFDVILRNYYFLLQGEKITQSKVYVKYKEYFKNKTEKEILDDLVMLRDATKTISTKIYNRDSLTYSLFDFCLNQLQITQMIPALLLISFSDDKEVCQECIDLLTKYVCILWISESPYNKLEQLNKEMFANKLDIRNHRDIHGRIVATAEIIRNEISELDNDLQRTIENRMFEKKQHAALRQFLIAIFNRFHDEHQFKEPTLEHINPQCGIDNFKDRGFASTTEYSDYVKKIGNAVVLGFGSNCDAQHKWDQKMKVYKNPGQPKNVVMLFKKLGSDKEYDELLDQNFYVDLPSMNDGSEYLTKDEIDLRTRKFAESISKILLNTSQ